MNFSSTIQSTPGLLATSVMANAGVDCTDFSAWMLNPACVNTDVNWFSNSLNRLVYGQSLSTPPPAGYATPNLSPPDSILRTPPASGEQATATIDQIIGQNWQTIQSSNQSFFTSLANTIQPPANNSGSQNAPWYQVILIGALVVMGLDMFGGKRR